ncbi:MULTISPECIES: DUF5710 domain-containing protein [Burkholderiaceae]|jgi:putative DNA primase/helicase|uniref:DUF5710 domain-containing protein n=1 Tax=Burkholderiaceae TaxID=119060 RepID=UPI000D04A71B|nr:MULTISPECIES: DUF5710 domain-containing protein [Burkholderiaceae]MBU9366406.1 DNA primase [Burkholderia multivorans]PRZ43852.1 putative DNA primase/helicase [Paraburkholderia fungorum]
MYSVMATRSKPMQDRAVAQFLNSVPCAQRRSALTDASRAASVLAGERIFLAVPSRDIQKARALGAKWDRDLRVCWIASSADKGPFSPWIVDDAALRAAGIDRDDVLAEFAEAMRSYGLVPKDVIADGKWHCAMVETRSGPRSHGGYVLNMDGAPRGYIRNFIGGEGAWRYHGAKLTLEQRAALEAQNRDRQAARDEAVRREQQRVAERSLEILTQLPRISGRAHPYLERKGVGAYGVRVANAVTDDISGLLNKEDFRRSKAKYLVIPGRDINDQFLTAQVIGPDGFKMFVRDARKKGAFHLIGVRRTRDLLIAPAVLFVEGYATGASLHEATGLPVVIAFDAKNLIDVAKSLARILPASQPKVVCCDNDQFFIENALDKIARTGGTPHATATSVRVRAGVGEATREVQICGALADGHWHQAAHGKYRLQLESAQGVVRALTLDVVIPGERHVRVTTRNTGVACGEEAARILGAAAVSPAFASLEARPTDFNDLAGAEGPEAVATTIQPLMPFSLNPNPAPACNR